MKALVLSLALVALPLAACQTTGPGSVPSLQLTSAKGLFAAEAAFEAATIAAEAGVKSGSLHGKNAQTVLTAMNQAHDALNVGRAAYLAGNLALVATQTALANASIQTAQAALPAK